jgi:Tol biopolymer transport system component
VAKSLGYTILTRLAISPDGKLLAFVHGEALPAIGIRLAVIPVGGGKPLQTFKVANDVSDLRWSPDGQSLQYFLTRNGSTDVWAQLLAGDESKQLVRGSNPLTSTNHLPAISITY